MLKNIDDLNNITKLAKLAILPTIAMYGLLGGQELAQAADCSGGYASCITYSGGKVVNAQLPNHDIVYNSGITTNSGANSYPIVLMQHRFRYNGSSKFAYIVPLLADGQVLTDDIRFETMLSNNIEYYGEVDGYSVYRIKRTNLGVVIIASHQFPGGEYKEAQVAHSFHGLYADLFRGGIVLKRDPSNTSNKETPAGIYFDIVPVLLGPVSTNQLIYANTKLLTVKITPSESRGGGVNVPTFDVYYKATVNHSARGTCSYTGARNLSIPMQRIQASQIASKGSTFYGGSTTIALDCSANATVDHKGVRTGVIPFAVLTDQKKPSNVTDILTTNTGSGYARNVGIKLRRSDANPNTFLKFGPDSRAKGTVNQWQFGALTEIRPEITLEAHYVNNAPDGQSIGGGKVQGVATMTFSYQ